MKKNSVLFILFCMFSNALLPAGYAVGAADGYSPGGSILPSALMQFCSDFAQPFAKIGGIVSNENPLEERIQGPSRETERNTSADYSLAAVARTAVSRNIVSAGMPAVKAVTEIPSPALSCPCVQQRHWPPGGLLSCLMLLMYLVVLSRSNLPGALQYSRVRGR